MDQDKPNAGTDDLNGVDYKRIKDPAIREIIDLAATTKEHAYCPYSDFPVGSAVLCLDGTIYTGCNIENAAYPLGVCAEKTAACKAISEGHRKFRAVAVCSNMRDHFITPCGSCRQFLSEFGMDMDVYMTKPDKSFVKMKIRELLPLGFDPEKLSETKVTTDRGLGERSRHSSGILLCGSVKASEEDVRSQQSSPTLEMVAGAAQNGDGAARNGVGLE